MPNRIYKIPFASVYSLYIEKAEKQKLITGVICGRPVEEIEEPK